MADVDDSLNKISLQDKVKLLDSIKRVREAEIKKKGEIISREIEELEEKRKKEMKALEDQLKKESTELDEEMFKAMDALFFRDRRTYLMNRARLERTQEIADDLPEAHALKGESVLYDISERIFAGQNLKLHAITSQSSRNEESGYLGSNSQPGLFESYHKEDSDNKYQSGPDDYPAPNPTNYSSRSKSWMEQFEDEFKRRGF